MIFPTRSGFWKNFSHTMTENAEIEHNLPAIFDDSRNEGSFDGFEGRQIMIVM